jgi:hypothetical protein
MRGFLEDGHLFQSGFDVGNLLFSQLEFRFLFHIRFNIIYKTKDLYGVNFEDAFRTKGSAHNNILNFELQYYTEILSTF